MGSLTPSFTPALTPYACIRQDALKWKLWHSQSSLLIPDPFLKTFRLKGGIFLSLTHILTDEWWLLWYPFWAQFLFWILHYFKMLETPICGDSQCAFDEGQHTMFYQSCKINRCKYSILLQRKNSYSKATKKPFEKEHTASLSRAVWVASYLESVWVVNNKLSQKMLLSYLNFNGVIWSSCLASDMNEALRKYLQKVNSILILKRQQISSVPLTWLQVCY